MHRGFAPNETVISGLDPNFGSNNLKFTHPSLPTDESLARVIMGHVSLHVPASSDEQKERESFAQLF